MMDVLKAKELEKNIPQDIGAEMAVLGAVFLDNDRITDIIGILDPDSFYLETHRHIFQAMLDLSTANKPIDEILLGERLKELGKLEEAGSYAYLAELSESAPVSGNITYYASIVHENSILRDLISLSLDIQRNAADTRLSVESIVTKAQNAILDIADKKLEQEKSHIRDIMIEVREDVEKRSQSKNPIVGLSTGYKKLDAILGGLIPGNLYYIAARPGMGKSALAICIAGYTGIIQNQKSLPIYSLEMSRSQNAKRLLSAFGKVDQRFLKMGSSDDQEMWDRFTKMSDRLSGTHIHLFSSIRNIDQAIASIKNIDRKRRCSMAVLDYLQLMEIERKRSKEEEIGNISKKLKWLATDLNIPVLVVAQLNRKLEDRKDKRPILSDIRDSGQIEQDANAILFIYREDYYREDEEDYISTGIGEIIIAKHRDGPTGTIQLGWNGKLTKFYNLD